MAAELEIKYASYFAKERSRANRLKALGDVQLPESLDYNDLQTLSTEARQKLSAVRPMTLAQAGQIAGISPADLQNLVFELQRASIIRRSPPAARAH